MVGRRYRVVHDFTAMRDTFAAGEILIYRSQGWSRYDEMTGYFFQGPNDTKIRAWDVPDRDDLATWRDLFEEVPVAPAVTKRGE